MIIPADWKQSAGMRDNNPVQLGSPCIIVKIDESLEENISANCARAMGIR